ncbi:hypothetical protein FB468_1731 [Leucobacter komagatae]|uniref:Uncharacterized protein n=1 Tax=Leucobacter komagatae TaxID=55969 RepID=A0A542Y6J2_9MICO|nr:hypothetical protein [Leucobacter komagatae]TQL43701.1 hypothetical protein FB468_1731 [Leucobacter komagatae]
MDFIHTLVDVVSVLPAFEVPDLEPDFNAPFVKPSLHVVNSAAAIATIACLLGVVLSVILLAVGKLSQRNQNIAWIVLACALVGTMLLGSATALMTYVGGIPLF